MFTLSYKNMHVRADNIFRIALELYNGHEFLEVDTETYQTLGPEFKATRPEVLDFARLFNAGTVEITAVTTGAKQDWLLFIVSLLVILPNS